MKISNILFLHVVKLLVPIKVYQEKTSDDDSDQNRCHRKHADRLREPDSTTLWYLQIGPEVERIR